MNKPHSIIAFFAILLVLSTTATAQPRIGEKIPEFQLQGTDGQLYGIQYADAKVSILSIIGYS